MPDKQLPADSTPQPVVIYSQSRFSTKQKILFLALPVVLILITVIFLLNYLGLIKLSEFFKKPDALLLTVGQQKVYLSEVKQVAKEQYLDSSITKSVMQNSLDILVERIILNQEAQRLNISVSDDEINLTLPKIQPDKPKQSYSKSFTMKAKYDLLKNKIISALLESRQANVVKLWVPSDEYLKTQGVSEKDKQTMLALRTDIQNALIDLEKKVREGETMLKGARFIHDKYSTLSSRVTLNGFILEKARDENLLTQPALYTFNPKNAGVPFYEALFIMKDKEIKRFMEPDKSGGSIIQIISIQHGASKNYQDWLESKKQQLIKVYSSL